MVVREDDILYMERKGRVTYIQCKDECIDTPDKLSELEKYLSTVAFVRCHNSYIVNLTAVKEFARTEFLMIDKVRIPISRYKLQETREKLMAWFALGYGG